MLRNTANPRSGFDKQQAGHCVLKSHGTNCSLVGSLTQLGCFRLALRSQNCVFYSICHQRNPLFIVEEPLVYLYCRTDDLLHTTARHRQSHAFAKNHFRFVEDLRC